MTWDGSVIVGVMADADGKLQAFRWTAETGSLALGRTDNGSQVQLSTDGSSVAFSVNQLRKICLALPAAGERLSHGEPTWFAGKGKVFAMLDNHHHGAAHLSVWLPQAVGVQESLVELDASRFFRPPYVGPRGWVGVVLDTKPDWTMVAQLVHEAFAHVATRKLVAQLSLLSAAK